jgi:hypothetical protein
LTWIESAQALAVMAGVDAHRVHEWGQAWCDSDFQRHDQLGKRSSLLRVFVAITRSSLLSGGGASIRKHLGDRFSVEDRHLKTFGLGLYTAAVDVFHHLKRTGNDLSELRAQGLFESNWAGRLIAPWKDVCGRTVNLVSWNQAVSATDIGSEILFGRDLLGSQRTPFQLELALSRGSTDLILFDDPLQAVLCGCMGLEDPFPIASSGGLTSEQVEILEEVLPDKGTLTVMSNYDPETYGSRFDRTTHNLNLLEDTSFPVFLIDSKLLSEGLEEEVVTPTRFLQDKGLDSLQDLLKLSEVITSESQRSEKQTFWSGLSEAFKGLSKPEETPISEDIPDQHGDPGEEFGGPLLNAAEFFGQRIAQGFMRVLNGGQSGNPDGSQHEALPIAGSLLQLAAQNQFTTPPPRFSVDRLEESARVSVPAKASGWTDLDSKGVRFRPGELILVGARTGHGKSSMIHGLLHNWLVLSEDSLLLFSLQESELQAYHRLLSLTTASQGTGVQLQELRNHKERAPRLLDITQGEKLEAAKRRLRDWQQRLQIAYCPGWQVRNLEEYALQLAEEEGGLGALFVDPLDNLTANNPSQPNLSTDCARRLKSLAVSLGCPVIATVRTSDPEQGDTPSEAQPKDNYARPHLMDFPREIAQEADLILGLMSYGSVYSILTDNTIPELTPLDLGVIKDRSGPSGQWITLDFDRPFCRLRNRQKRSSSG